MINPTWIHENDESEMMNALYEEDKAFFSEKQDELIMLESQSEIDIFMYEEEGMKAYVEGVSNILDSIGQRIVDIVNKCLEKIEEMYAKFQKFIWERKGNDAKLKSLEKKRPDIAEKVKVLVNENKIRLNDFKDINTFYKTIDETLREIEKADGKTVKAKFEKAKDKLATAQKVIVAVGATATAILAIDKLTGSHLTNKVRQLSCHDLTKVKPDKDTQIDEMLTNIKKTMKNVKDQQDVTCKKLREERKKANPDPDKLRSLQDALQGLASITTELSEASRKLLNERIQAGMEIYRAQASAIKQFGVDI